MGSYRREITSKKESTSQRISMCVQGRGKVCMRVRGNIATYNKRKACARKR